MIAVNKSNGKNRLILNLPKDDPGRLRDKTKDDLIENCLVIAQEMMPLIRGHFLMTASSEGSKVIILEFQPNPT